MPLLSEAKDKVSVANPDNMGRTDWGAELSEANPLPGQRYFDPSVDKELIPQQENRDFAGMMNYGVGDSQLGGAGQMGFGGGDDAMTKALSNRYEDQSKNAVQEIKQRNEANAPAMKSGEDATISRELASERSNDVQNFNAQYSYQVQRQNIYNQWISAQAQAKAGIFGAIFGGIASIGGAVLGGAIGKKL